MPDFHDERKPAAVLKHGILTSYLWPWVKKVGSSQVDRRVFVVDGYAGRPLYRDGNPESPTLIRDFADEAAAAKARRVVDYVFIELDRGHSAALAEEFGDKALQGRFEDNVREVLRRAGSAPLFVYVDPCGSGPPMDSLVQLLTSPRSHSVELLLHFSKAALRDATKHLPSYDRTYGGKWYHAISSADRDWQEQLLDGFCRRLEGRLPREFSATPVAVPERWDGPAKYWLIHVTGHDAGRYLFAVSLPAAFREFHALYGDEQAQLGLFGGVAGVTADRDRYLDVQLRVEENLRRMWLTTAVVHLGKDVYDLLEGVLGFALPRDISAAARSAGAEVVGKDEKMRLVRPAR